MRDLPLQEIGAVALYMILFQGGLSTGLRAWRANARPIVLLGLPGTAATAGAIAVAGHLIGLDWSLAIFVGVALSPTDPAAVYATLRSGGRAGSRPRTVLEGESGFNDPVGISFMVVALAALGTEGASFGDGVLRLIEELGIGIVGGIVGAAILLGVLRATHHLEDGLQGIALLVGAIIVGAGTASLHGSGFLAVFYPLLVGAIIVGAGTASLHGSGFLAVYISGLALSDAWGKQDASRHAVPEALAAVSEPLLFGLLGAAFAGAVGVDDVWALRDLLRSSRCSSRHARVRRRGLRARVPCRSWGGLKGAVPLLLAGYPALDGLGEAGATESIVLVATAASIVVQGATLRFVAARVPAADTVPTDAGIVPGRAKAGG